MKITEAEATDKLHKIIRMMAWGEIKNLKINGHTALKIKQGKRVKFQRRTFTTLKHLLGNDTIQF